MRTQQKFMTVAVAGGLMLSGGALTACGNTVENAVEQAAGDAIDGDVDVDLDNGGISITSSDGTQVQIGGNATIPDSWPSAIPVFEGGTLASVTASADGASVSAVWFTDQAPADAIASYDALMTAAGYVPAENVVVGLDAARYTGNGYTVSTLATETDGKTTLVLSGEKGT